MALNKDTLGQALYNRVQQYNEVDIPPNEIEAKRLDYWKGVADEIIEHFKTNIQLTIPGTGLNAPNGAVTGQSITGTIT